MKTRLFVSLARSVPRSCFGPQAASMRWGLGKQCGGFFLYSLQILGCSASSNPETRGCFHSHRHLHAIFR